MRSRLLIINCFSEYFVNIPMGTFGLCDYLNRSGVPVKILNLSLYKAAEVEQVLHHTLGSFNPTHIGLIFHWQETTEGFLWTGKKLKAFRKDIPIVAGGFTAGYFGEDLLTQCRFVDCLIKGDPEKPLEMILHGWDIAQIPNLIYRTGSGIASNKMSYSIDTQTMSGISYANISYLLDHALYIEAINRKLGFPVFIGRGCNYTCSYCGGSRSAYASHSRRTNPVVRSVDAVVTDLRRLKDFTKKIYLCHENDRDYMKVLFSAIKKEKSLVKVFQLNYGAWKLPDREFLNLYKDVFIFSDDQKPVFELSPEVFLDTGRKRIKHSEVYYSIQELKENLHWITRHFSDRINVSIFFSRYHDTVKTYADMKKEIAGIFRFKHDLLLDDISNIHVSYNHLSTDVASRYWKTYIGHPGKFDTLVSAIRKLKKKEQMSFNLDNLCIYTPESLSDEEIVRCELIISILKMLEKYFHEMFHILFRCLDEQIIDVVEEIVNEVYARKPGNIFQAIDHEELLGYIQSKIIHEQSLLDKISFIDDLITLNIKKAEFQLRPQGSKSIRQTTRPILNLTSLSVNDHDYLDLRGFLKRLEKEGAGNVKPQKTVFIFLDDEILSMDYETYSVTLKHFETGISLEEYYDLMVQKRIFTPSYHTSLIAKLFQNNVLY